MLNAYEDGDCTPWRSGKTTHTLYLICLNHTNPLHQSIDQLISCQFRKHSNYHVVIYHHKWPAKLWSNQLDCDCIFGYLYRWAEWEASSPHRDWLAKDLSSYGPGSVISLGGEIHTWQLWRSFSCFHWDVQYLRQVSNCEFARGLCATLEQYANLSLG